MVFDLLHRDEAGTIDARNRPAGTDETAISPITVEELAESVKRMEIKNTTSRVATLASLDQRLLRIFNGCMSTGGYLRIGRESD